MGDRKVRSHPTFFCPRRSLVRLTSISPTPHPAAPAPRRTFLAFLGAKKGAFFGVEAKKVWRLASGVRRQTKPIVRAASANSFSPRHLRERGRG